MKLEVHHGEHMEHEGTVGDAGRMVRGSWRSIVRPIMASLCVLCGEATAVSTPGTANATVDPMLPTHITWTNGLARHTAEYAARPLAWESLATPSGVRAVFPHPARSETVYALASAGLMRSDDDAATWRRVPLAGLDAAATITALAFRPGETESLCLGTRAHGVWLTTDGGGTARCVGSKATGMASDAIASLVFAPQGDPFLRTVLAAHGAETTGISRGNIDEKTWSVVASQHVVHRILPGDPERNEFYLFAADSATPETVGVYYASRLDAYWQPLVSDTLPTDGAWRNSSQAMCVTTLDKGVIQISRNGGTVETLGGEDLEWFSAAAVWGANAEHDLLALYQPSKLGLLAATNGLAKATDLGRGLYHGSFVSEGSHIRPNAGGTRFYGAVNGALWVGRVDAPLRVYTVVVTPSDATVAAIELDESRWYAFDEDARDFVADRRAAPLATGLAAALRESFAIPSGPVTLQARVGAPTGLATVVTADLSRFGLASSTPLAFVTNGLYRTTFDVVPEYLSRRQHEWRPTFPDPMPITVTARVPDALPAGGVGLFALHVRPESFTFWNEGKGLKQRDERGSVALSCLRDPKRAASGRDCLRLDVGPGPWRISLGHLNMRQHIGTATGMAFSVRSLGRPDAELRVHLADNAGSTITPGVPIVSGGYIVGGSVSADGWRPVAIPVAELRRGGGAFAPEAFGWVTFSGDSATRRTYLVDDIRFLLSSAPAAPAVDAATSNGESAALRAAAGVARDRARFAEAVAAIHKIATDVKVDAAIRQRAFRMLIDLHARNNSRIKTIEAAEAFRTAFPQDPAIDRETVFLQADQYARLPAAASNSTPAVAALQAYAQRRAGDNESCAQSLLRVADFHRRVDQWDAARDAARAALARDPVNPALGSEAIWLLQDVAKRTDRAEERAQALEQSLDPKYRDALTDDALTSRRSACVETLRQLKRYDDLRRFLAEFERTDPVPLRRQQWALAIANACYDQGRTNEAHAACERVFTAHPEANACWYEAQSRLVDLLVAQKRTDEALSAARILYDAARTGNDAERVVKRMVDILRQANPSDPRADALSVLQRHGPAGRDGQPGTADDPQPVLPAIGYPDLTARRKAFDAVAATLGDSADASLQRAWCAVYTGDPRRAVAHFADALRRCQVSQVGDIAKALQQNGARPLNGNNAELAELGYFIAHGPAGADGTPGTEDDRPDPFAALGVPAVSASPGGLVPLSATEARDLQALLVELRALIRRPGTRDRQLAAIDVYERTVAALVVVDRRETLDWILAVMRSETDGRVLGPLARLGANVARSDQLHLADSRQFIADVVSLLAQSQPKLAGEIRGVQRHLEVATDTLLKKPSSR